MFSRLFFNHNHKCINQLTPLNLYFTTTYTYTDTSSLPIEMKHDKAKPQTTAVKLIVYSFCPDNKLKANSQLHCSSGLSTPFRQLWGSIKQSLTSDIKLSSNCSLANILLYCDSCRQCALVTFSIGLFSDSVCLGINLKSYTSHFLSRDLTKIIYMVIWCEVFKIKIFL